MEISNFCKYRKWPTLLCIRDFIFLCLFYTAPFWYGQGHMHKVGAHGAVFVSTTQNSLQDFLKWTNFHHSCIKLKDVRIFKSHQRLVSVNKLHNTLIAKFCSSWVGFLNYGACDFLRGACGFEFFLCHLTLLSPWEVIPHMGLVPKSLPNCASLELGLPRV